jgi:general stress protein CsbA
MIRFQKIRKHKHNRVVCLFGAYSRVFLASLYPETSIPVVVILLLIIMVASENTPLILESGGHNGHGGGAALASKTTFTTLLGTTQLILTLCFIFGTGYDPKDYSAAEYIIFRDIAVMLFLGFGFLMTFLGKNTTMTEKRKRDEDFIFWNHCICRFMWFAVRWSFFHHSVVTSHSLDLTLTQTHTHIG